MIKIKIFLSLLAICLIGVACASANKGASSREAYVQSEENESSDGVADGESTGKVTRAVSDKRTLSPSTERADDPESPKKAQRMMIYAANLVNRVTELDMAITQTKSLVKKYNGYIEKQWIQKQPARASFKIRVPVANFDLIINDLAEIGKVQSRNISAQDITKQFSDLSQKLENRQKLLDRLYVILKKTSNTKQKIRILNEIARLQKEIDLMETRKKYLANKASFSTIEISFHAVQKLVINTGSAIKWIRNLAADKRTLWESPDFKFALPVGFIDSTDSFKENGDALYLSPDGVKIRVASLDNNPRGDMTFYKKSILYDQQRFPEKIIEEKMLGDFFILSVSRLIAYKSTVYTMGIKVDGDRIHFIEIYYPDEDTFKKHQATIEKNLGIIEQKSIFEKMLEVVW